eukprot:Opistho-2@43955
MCFFLCFLLSSNDSKMSIMFLSLPIEIVVYHIAPLLSKSDRASLAGVNSRLGCVLKHVRLYTLRRVFATKYWESAEFRAVVWANIPRERLAFVLRGSSIPTNADICALSGVHSVDLSYCEGFSGVSALAGVHKPNLSGCTGVTDVSALGGVHKLNLTECIAVTDVSALGGVYKLNLTECIAVTDVSALGGVHSLNLFFCDGVTDVSALGGVHSL